MRRTLTPFPFDRLRGDRSGAVAPTIALSLFALIAIGGTAFDYARMASLDTELQNAADQAALAAASQLDGQDGACARASAAAVGMVANFTLMANDGGGTGIAVTGEPECDATGTIRFWQDSGRSVPATSDQDASFVEVLVEEREAFFALTPVVAAFSSGDIGARALAGLDQALCRTPPVMICNPQETSTSTDFDVTALIGVGLRLVTVGQGNGSWAPGNFGYLRNNGTGGVPGIRENLGWDNSSGECVSATGVNTKPGASVTVTGALNTRFDIYDNNNDCPGGGSCPASVNSVKDVKRPANASGGNSCRLHNQGWSLPTGYYGSGSVPSSASTPLPVATIPAAMGHPRDMCHAVASTAAGACTGPIGNGAWDRDAYFRTNYRRSNGTRWTNANWRANTLLPANARRYDVYSWEIANRGTVVDGVTVLGPQPAGATGNTPVARGAPVCSAGQGYGSGTVPSNTAPDRRKIAVAVVNCLAEGVSGNSVNVPVVDWLDVFLVEPSMNRARTNDGDIYAEVVGRTANATNEGAVQLIKKSIPYLIE